MVGRSLPSSSVSFVKVFLDIRDVQWKKRVLKAALSIYERRLTSYVHARRNRAALTHPAIRRDEIAQQSDDFRTSDVKLRCSVEVNHGVAAA